VSASFLNPVITDDHGTDHGDPFVMSFLGEYFLYHTTADGELGISVHRSQDLVNWTPCGFALEAGGAGHWAQSDLWAPEVVYLDGVFYMYVSGARVDQRGDVLEDTHRQGLARASTPLGPFVLDDAPLVSDVWSIDGHPFQDEDGSLWLFYNVRTEQTRYRGLPGSGTVVDRLTAPDRLEGSPARVSFPSQAWEGGRSEHGYWNEGSWVLKRRGRYFQLYSGGDYRDSTYGIGVSEAPRPQGTWRKGRHNPIFRSGRRITGPGHHSIILAPDGVSYYSVYHGYDGERQGRKVNLDPLVWSGDRPIIGTRPFSGRPTEISQAYPPAPMYDPAVPFWHADMWLCGGALDIDGCHLELGERTEPCRVRVNQGRAGMRIWVDGQLRAQQPGPHDPAIETSRKIEHLALTSHLADETIRWLAPGERHVWSWGGSSEVHVSIAVKGSAHVLVGREAVDVDTGEQDRYAVFQLSSSALTEVSVEGRGTGAEVTDLTISSR
jgi:GH43 family beta-xylosidase